MVDGIDNLTAKACFFGLQPSYSNVYVLGLPFLRSFQAIFDAENNELSLGLTKQSAATVYNLVAPPQPDPKPDPKPDP